MAAILCVFAHPDDESFGPAGTIARYVSKGVPVHLLTFTRGQRGTLSEPLASPEDLGLLREHELRAACAVLGIESLTLLDYMDGELDRAPEEELAAHAARALDATAAGVVITFGPLGITRHGDHIAAHRAAVRASQARDVRLYYAAVEGEWADRMEVEGPEREPTHRIDITGFFDRKLAALACHSSQQDAREFFLELSRRGQTHESYHRASPPADPGRTYTDLWQ